MKKTISLPGRFAQWSIREKTGKFSGGYKGCREAAYLFLLGTLSMLAYGYFAKSLEAYRAAFIFLVGFGALFLKAGYWELIDKKYTRKKENEETRYRGR